MVSDFEKAYNKYLKLGADNMKKLGTYRLEYREALKIWAKMKAEYDILFGRYLSGNFRYFELTADGGERKGPIVTVLEALRKDILAYSNQLQMTPLSNKEEAVEENKTGMSRLEEISKGLDLKVLGK